MNSNFCTFRDMIIDYLEINGNTLEIVSNLHDISINDADKNNIRYVYNGKINLDVIDMDKLAKKGYKVIKNAEGKDNIVNTADGFLVNNVNEWFFIEFKDSEFKAENTGLKNSVLKKAYSNWYMLLDILYFMNENGKTYFEFAFENPIKFAKEHICYVIVCSTEKNALLYQKVKAYEQLGEKYTPPFLQRIKSYMFKDAYVYTEEFFEQKFVNKFVY